MKERRINTLLDMRRKRHEAQREASSDKEGGFMEQLLSKALDNLELEIKVR